MTPLTLDTAPYAIQINPSAPTRRRGRFFLRRDGTDRELTWVASISDAALWAGAVLVAPVLGLPHLSAGWVSRAPRHQIPLETDTATRLLLYAYLAVNVRDHDKLARWARHIATGDQIEIDYWHEKAMQVQRATWADAGQNRVIRALRVLLDSEMTLSAEARS